MLKKMMILALSGFFVYGVSLCWQAGYDPYSASREEKEAMDLFRNAAEQVLAKAKEPSSEEELFNSALDTMLQNLDPHSNYFSPEMYKELMEDQEGRFFGIGVLITKPTASSPLLVINPIQGTPAYKAGLRSADLITEVEGRSTEKMALKESIKMLKGPRGTKVTITIVRDEGEPFKVTLERDEVPKASVPYSFMIKDKIGYVKVIHFGESTAEEFEAAIKDLAGKGADSFIIDLRDNPGGSLKAAIDICSILLPKRAGIVSLRPRRGIERKFTSDGCGAFCDQRLVVLMNMGSASASEIVAGALKDDKRAVIVGSRSWGKGLVQTVTPLIRGAAAITTAHYFTPSGVNIQRSFASRDSYLFPGEEGTEEARGAGGIEPDIKVESGKIPPLALKLEMERAFLDYVSKLGSRDETLRNGAENAQVLGGFREYLKKKGFEFTEEEWNGSKEYMVLAVKREYRTMKEGPGAGFEAMMPLDEPLKKAVEVIEKEEPVEKAA